MFVGSLSRHKTQHIVSLKDEYEENKATLGKTGAKSQQMIQERQLKIRELSKEDGDRQITDSVQVFAKVIQYVREDQAPLIDMIENKQLTADNRGNRFIKNIEMEISELIRRTSELEQLSRTEDHLEFLQSFPSFSAVPPTNEWSEVRVQSSSEGGYKESCGSAAGEIH